jgi:hypothetical protein
VTAHRVPIILAAARNNVPAVSNSTTFARDGGLLSYGADAVDRATGGSDGNSAPSISASGGGCPGRWPTAARRENAPGTSTGASGGIVTSDLTPGPTRQQGSTSQPPSLKVAIADRGEPALQFENATAGLHWARQRGGVAGGGRGQRSTIPVIGFLSAQCPTGGGRGGSAAATGALAPLTNLQLRLFLQGTPDTCARHKFFISFYRVFYLGMKS